MDSAMQALMRLPRSQGGIGSGDCKAPPRGWSQSGKLLYMKNPPTVSLQQVFPEAGIYTVQFDVIPAVDAPVPFAFANIAWSVNGNTIRRRVSLISGMALSGAGEAIQVVAFDSTPSAEAGNFGTPYTVTITCVEGLRGAQSQQPYLCPQNPINGGSVYSLGPTTNTSVDIPQNVGVTSVRVTVGSQDGAAIPNQAAQVEQNDVGNIYDPRDNPGWVPITQGCTSIELINNSATDSYNFGVFFGIDG